MLVWSHKLKTTRFSLLNNIYIYLEAEVLYFASFSIVAIYFVIVVLSVYIISGIQQYVDCTKTFNHNNQTLNNHRVLCCFQILMNVLLVLMIAVLMQIVQILMAHLSATAYLDIVEMEHHAQVGNKTNSLVFVFL